MTKKLGKKQIQENVSKYNETTELYFTIENEEYVVKVSPFLSPVEIDSMFLELQNDFIGYKKHGIDIDDNLVFSIISAYIALHFSDIYNPIKNKFKKEEDYFKSKIQYIKELLSSDYYKEIMEVFSEKELEKVYDKLLKIKLANDKINTELAKVQNKIANLDIKNEEVRNKFQNFNDKPKRIPEV